MSARGKQKRGKITRKTEVIDTKKNFLIITNGKETETKYFKQFKSNQHVIKVQVEFINGSPLDLVKGAVKLKKEREERISKKFNQKFNYDEVWCVFDKDLFEEKDLIVANTIARSNSIEFGMTNSCFELWLILHFGLHESAINKDDARKKITEKFKRDFNRMYEKNDDEIFNLLFPKINTAISNAEKIRNNHLEARKQNLYLQNPYTHIDILVKSLLDN